MNQPKTITPSTEASVASRTFDKTGKLVSETPSTKPPERRRRKVIDDSAAEAPAPSIEDVRAAIALLAKSDKSAWTKDGKPRVEALEKVLGVAVTDDQRDAAWALNNEASPE